MSPIDAMLAVVEAIESTSVPYILVGSFSSNAYGLPRATQDADFVLELGHHLIREVADRLGDHFVLDPQMSFETVTGTSRYIVRIKRSKFKIEMFILSDDPYDRERFQRRCQVAVEGRSVWLPSAEDVIITKLRWSKQGSRGKDLDDAANVLSVQRDRLDWTYLERWCDELGTRALLEKIRKEPS